MRISLLIFALCAAATSQEGLAESSCPGYYPWGTPPTIINKNLTPKLMEIFISSFVVMNSVISHGSLDIKTGLSKTSELKKLIDAVLESLLSQSLPDNIETVSIGTVPNPLFDSYT